MLRDIFGLQGKVALVTGAGRGLGRAAALALAEAGAAVALVSRTRGELDSLREEITDLGATAIVEVCDLSSPEVADPLIAAVTKQLGRLDILLNNAGVAVPDEAMSMSAATAELHWSLNLRTPIALSRAAAQVMIANGGTGKIINVSSLAALRGFVDRASYGVSKAALSGFTRTMAVELARAGHDIQVNSIAPGAFGSGTNGTPPMDAAVKERARKIMALIPMRRPASPPEIKGVVLFLASAASSYVTGQEIVVDGGWMAAAF